jgi:hypothetical protein
MTRAKVAIWLFAVVSGLSFIAALVPLLKGGRANAAFLGIGVVWLVIAVASAKSAGRARKGPPAA